MDIKDIILAASIAKGAGGSGGGVTKEYVDTQVGAVSERVDDVEDVIPSTATAQNKLATSADVSGTAIHSTSTTSPLTDSADGYVQGLTIYGRSEVVDGEIKSVGEGYVVIDLGTLSWSALTQDNKQFFYSNSIRNKYKTGTGFICAEYVYVGQKSDNEMFSGDDKVVARAADGQIKIRDDRYSTSDAFIASLKGKKLAYELADPSQGNLLAVKTDDGTGVDGTMSTFTTGTPLRGIPDSDIRDVMAWDGSAGEVTKNCAKVRLADLTWQWWNEYPNIIYAEVVDKQVGLCDMMCSAYPYNQNISFSYQYESAYPDKMVYCATNSDFIFIKNTDYSTKEDFVASLGDAKLVYELATPTTTPLTDAEIAAFRALRTYDSTTNVTITDEPDYEFDYLKNTENGQAVADIQKDLQGQIDEVKNTTKPRVYAFYVDQNDSNPATCVHPYYNTKYGCDNLFYQNAYMDYEKDEFNYGSWKDFIYEFFKPCMLAYDGHVDYYLDPDDYEAKLDGGTSDIKDINYNGNVMVQIKTLYFKRWTTDGKYYCIISDKKLDKSFKAFAHHDIKGNVLDYIYRAAYDGSYDGTRLRSISGIDYHNVNALTVNKIMSNTTRQQEIDFAKANNDTDEKGEGWNILHKAEWDLINDLLLLIGMSTNTQATFGNGNISSYVSTSNTGIIATGTMDKKGLFYGKNDNVSGVKVFGFEHPWGNIWKSCLGWILSANQHLVKMTPGNEDGSTATDYNLDGTGYVATGKSITAKGYISAFDGADTGFLPTAASGSATTYMCAYVWQGTAIYFALVGGVSNSGAHGGAFCANLGDSAADANWSLGAALSYKPLARG